MTYLDANVIIRLIEGDAATVLSIRQALAGMTHFVTSDLSRIECRCRPMRLNDAAILGLFDAFFAKSDLTLIPINRSVIDRATELRAQFNLKTPDAIHAASAVVAGAKVFSTGDNVFSRVAGLVVRIV